MRASSQRCRWWVLQPDSGRFAGTGVMTVSDSLVSMWSRKPPMCPVSWIPIRSTSQHPLTRFSWHHGCPGDRRSQIFQAVLPAPDAQPSQPGRLLHAATPVLLVKYTVALPPACWRKTTCFELFVVEDAHCVWRTS